MAYVITSPCIDVKDGACVQCCPVDCIYEGERTLYIHPEECINCGVCVSVCPTEAIFHEEELPPAEARFTAVNREFFGPDVSALGSRVVRATWAKYPAIIRQSLRIWHPLHPRQPPRVEDPRMTNHD